MKIFTKRIFLLLIISVMMICIMNCSTDTQPQAKDDTSVKMADLDLTKCDIQKCDIIKRGVFFEYSVRTWSSMAKMADTETGLPVDRIAVDSNKILPGAWTSPTDIGGFIWSTIAARDLGIISGKRANSYLSKVLTMLETMVRVNGFYYNRIDVKTGQPSDIVDGDPAPYLISSVDNAWLAVGLMILREADADLASRTGAILKDMNFSYFFNADTGHFYCGYLTKTNEFYGDYGALNTEPRIMHYIAIGTQGLDPSSYYKLYRTVPANWDWQEQIPQGPTVEHLGVQVFEGHYTYPYNNGASIVPTWGGSMFEAFMPTLFVPEAQWGPKSWGVNHPRYANAQIYHGLIEAGYGYWGFSPSHDPIVDPSGTIGAGSAYRGYGVDAIGQDPEGNTSDEENTKSDYKTNPPTIPPASAYGNGVVAPYAVFLALEYAPGATLVNITKLRKNFNIYGYYGFYDAVSIKTGSVAKCYLILDQSMIIASLANYLQNGKLRNYFSKQIESKIRPLLEEEDFFSDETK